jgi:hypothetical protein
MNGPHVSKDLKGGFTTSLKNISEEALTVVVTEIFGGREMVLDALGFTLVCIK